MIPNDLETTGPPPSRRSRRTGPMVSPLEVGLAVLAVLVLAALVVAEPDILQAPFENGRTILFTFGGAALAAVAFAALLAFRVPPLVRIVVIGVPAVVVSWWVISPFFLDEKVEEGFETSIVAAQAAPSTPPSTPTPSSTSSPTSSPAPAAPAGAVTTATPTTAPPSQPASPVTTVPAGPVLLGAGSFKGLAGHDGTGDAGIFRTGEGAHVLRLENLDIDNGPDLRLYVLPGAEQVTPGDGSVYLGALRGNVGELTYELPAEFVPSSGAWTVLVWCEAFSVEFVGATLQIG